MSKILTKHKLFSKHRPSGPMPSISWFVNMCVFSNTKKIWLVRQNSSKIKFFAWQFYTLHEQKYSNLRPLPSINFPQGFRKSKKFGRWTSGHGGKRAFKRNEQMKKKISKKTFFAAAILDHFWAKMLKSETTSFHYFSPRIANL